MSADNPSWGEDKIFEELDLKFGIKHSASTIRKYMVKRRSPGDRQTWKTFLKNHGHEIFACDFMTQHTALFAVIYVSFLRSMNPLGGRFSHRHEPTAEAVFSPP
jgi:putative transposase